MTRQKTLKQRVRARMSKTGESYTTARAQLLRAPRRSDPARRARGPAPAASQAAPAAGDRLSDATIHRATKRGWDEWFALLDAWGGTERKHPEIARWLVDEHGVGSWWAQSITVGYERAHGMRAKHQMASGFSISINKTVAAPIERLRAAFSTPKLRAAWLGEGKLTPRPGRGGKASRFDWAQDGSRVVVTFTEKANGRVSVNVTHERLANAAIAERMKAWWRERLAALSKQLVR